MKRIVVIPAYNEARTIGDVLMHTRPFVDEMIVVNDGSTDETAEIARAHGATVLTHLINRGLGAAIGTGFTWAQHRGADLVMTLDADGQHDPREIPAFVHAIEQGADVVIGTRMRQNPHVSPTDHTHRSMPWFRVVAQWLGNLTTFFLFGAWVSDSQSGFRGFSAHALTKIRIQTNRMEVSSELIAETKKHALAYKEIPIQAIYTDYSLSKGQNFFVGLKTVVKLVLRRIMM